MNRLSAFGKRWTAVHELGYALGLDHAPKKFKSRAVMYQFCCPPFNTPQAYGKKVYREIWGGGKSGAKQEPARAAAPDVTPPVIHPV